LTAAQVEVTVTSVPSEVKQEYTTYGVPLLKTPSYCTRVAPNAQSGTGEERRAGTGREENVSNGQVRKEKWSGAILTSSEATARKGGYRESKSSVTRFMHKSKGKRRFSLTIHDGPEGISQAVVQIRVILPHRRLAWIGKIVGEAVTWKIDVARAPEDWVAEVDSPSCCCLSWPAGLD
jgi:hypothetical protein